MSKKHDMSPRTSMQECYLLLANNPDIFLWSSMPEFYLLLANIWHVPKVIHARVIPPPGQQP